jgi:hypothetical protein
MTYQLILLTALFILFSVDVQVASANACVVNSPRYLLTSDSVDWSMKIESGQICVRGLRFGTVVIETVKLISPPQSGSVRLLGPGFSYTAKPNFHGEDSFAVVVSGIANKIRGTSTIRVAVSVNEASNTPVSSTPNAHSSAPTVPTGLKATEVNK